MTLFVSLNSKTDDVICCASDDDGDNLLVTANPALVADSGVRGGDMMLCCVMISYDNEFQAFLNCSARLKLLVTVPRNDILCTNCMCDCYRLVTFLLLHRYMMESHSLFSCCYRR